MVGIRLKPKRRGAQHGILPDEFNTLHLFLFIFVALIKRKSLKQWLGLEAYAFERFMHLVILVGLPLILLLERSAYPDNTHYGFVRIGLAVLSLLIYLGSFRIAFIRRDFTYINYIVIYLVMSHFIFLTYINEFPFYLSSLLIALVVVTSVFFRSRTQLLIFQVAMFLLIVQASILSPSSDVNVRTFILLYVFMNICAYFIQDLIFRQREKLELAAKNLQRSNRSLEQFAYVISHDLQEPLRTITSYVQLLERRYQGKLDDEADEFIQFTVDAASRMRTMIQGTLAFSRAAASDNMVIKEIDLNEIMANVTSNLEASITSNRARINYPRLPVVAGDRTMISQLFQNLIGNAIKYRGVEDPLVIVDVTDEHNRWGFSIKDNGIGIPEKYHDTVFNIFNRVGAHNGARGTGIGLAVCKRIVLNHGGEIWVNSEEGKGSTFRFTLAKA